MDSQDNPPRVLVEQRIRNRLIEYFELASSFEAQQEYQRSVSIAHVPDEVINQWEDWSAAVQTSNPGRLTHPFSEYEIRALLRFSQEWEWISNNTPDPLPTLLETQQLPVWSRLRDAAGAALAVFSVRGRLPEDLEVQPDNFDPEATAVSLADGETELLIDGLSDDVAFVWVLVHLGLLSEEPGPPMEAEIDSALRALEKLSNAGLVRVGHTEYIDGGPAGRVAPVKHVEDPLPVVARRVRAACASGTDWEWSCWVANTTSGDEVAGKALELR